MFGMYKTGLRLVVLFWLIAFAVEGRRLHGMDP